MSEGRDRSRWAHTSVLLAMLYNLNRGKKPAKKPSDYNPYAERRLMRVTELKSMFVGTGRTQQKERSDG